MSCRLLSSPLAADEDVVATTFSQVQCEYLGQSWKDAYIRTLEMGFGLVRLGAYWSRIEKTEGAYDFSELDWQVEEARRRENTGCRVAVFYGAEG